MATNIDDIRNFMCVCETKNITRASEILGISQPALSYSIKRLEKEIQSELLIRLKNGIELTKIGEEFKDRASKLLSQWQELVELKNVDGILSPRTYSIGIHPSVALYYLESFLPKLTKEFPKINFNYIHGLSREMTEKVISWEVDFGIVVNPIKHPDLVIKKLLEDEVTIFYKSGAPKKIIFDPSLNQSKEIFKKLKLEFEGESTSSDLEVIAKLCSLSQGYAILPTRVATKYPGLKKLKDAPVYKDRVCLVYRPEKQRTPTSRAILKRFL